ncbi:MAG: hypothetical protein ACD_45C00141G0002 [uncultured bacterium]|nr:MAG: hypothetical protein ACD_45C00141G0002 [uncultured bacterium]OGT46445.1 MAG: hypothetical protein A3E82_00825 [Gammaproteobacteria bacterium RIFCSPHIGHO2_12_FULL_38_11]
MKKALIEKIQQAIMMYTIQCEGKHYKGDYIYSVSYINFSRHIPSHRKYDIRCIDKLLKCETETEVQLASKVYAHLTSIKTGFSLFWLIPIVTNHSTMREAIYHALYTHDSALFNACKTHTIPQLESSRSAIENEETANLTLNTHLDLEQFHLQLIEENKSLKLQLDQMQHELLLEKNKNTILTQNLKQALVLNECLKKKVEKLLQKRACNADVIRENISQSELTQVATGTSAFRI